jgi:hypothetical protein
MAVGFYRHAAGQAKTFLEILRIAESLDKVRLELIYKWFWKDTAL